MNFVRYEKDGTIVLGDVNPKRLQKMVDGYRTRGYIVNEGLSKIFGDDPVWVKKMNMSNVT